MGILEVLFGAGMVAGSLGIALVAFLVGGTIWGVKRSAGWGKNGKELPASPSAQASSKKAKPQLEASKEYRFLAEDGTADPKDVVRVLKSFEQDLAMGGYAAKATEALEKSEVKRRGVYDAIEREFDAGTMTWEKFATPVDAAVDTIKRNCAALANRVQRFETAEYQRLKRLHDAGGIEVGSANEQQWVLMRDELNDMDGLQDSNERILLELDALSAELLRLTGSDISNANDAILEELQQLTEDAKLYS